MTDYPIENEKTNISVRRLLKHAVFAFLSAFFMYSLIVYVYASENVLFAERYSSTVSAYFRQMLALITGWIPFSLTETAAVSGIFLFVFFAVRAFVLRFYYKEKGKLSGFIYAFVCILLAAASLFINTFGVCYKRIPLSQVLEIDTENITSDDVFVSAYICSTIASEYCDDVSRYPYGETYMDYSFDEMVDKIQHGYASILNDVPEHFSVKPVALSEPWTYTHISGMYFPITGESNINVNFPDYIMAFTTAHEMAHQLGVADEKDANMMAFLACMYSEDDYLIYAAHMNALDYLFFELGHEEAAYLANTLDRRIIHEMSSYYKFMDRYTHKTVSSISTGINDVYLKANGEKDGTKSYSNVAKLICGFMKEIYGEFYN